jgi:hypothetical protein
MGILPTLFLYDRVKRYYRCRLTPVKHCHLLLALSTLILARQSHSFYGEGLSTQVTGEPHRRASADSEALNELIRCSLVNVDAPGHFRTDRNFWPEMGGKFAFLEGDFGPGRRLRAAGARQRFHSPLPLHGA